MSCRPFKRAHSNNSGIWTYIPSTQIREVLVARPRNTGKLYALDELKFDSTLGTRLMG